ncbi:hypothetical protein JTB14_017038 [Gonioctena quinquepunctata]|nr:hypothetical protein JTB14_017038 [Gonioctena quinquepunctata]
MTCSTSSFAPLNVNRKQVQIKISNNELVSSVISKVYTHPRASSTKRSLKLGNILQRVQHPGWSHNTPLIDLIAINEAESSELSTELKKFYNLVLKANEIQTGEMKKKLAQTISTLSGTCRTSERN